MRTRRQFLGSTVLACATWSALSITARAQIESYPTGPIRAICPFPPGSGADTKIRFYLNKLSGRDRQAGHRRKQARRHGQYRDRNGGARQARRLHDLYRAGLLDARRRAESVQETRLRSDQRFRTHHDVVVVRLRAVRCRRQPVQHRRRTDGVSQGEGRGGVLWFDRAAGSRLQRNLQGRASD